MSEATIRVRVLTVYAGEKWESGREYDVPKDEALAMLARGQAEAVAQRSVDSAEKRPSRTKRESR